MPDARGFWLLLTDARGMPTGLCSSVKPADSPTFIRPKYKAETVVGPDSTTIAQLCCIQIPGRRAIQGETHSGNRSLKAPFDLSCLSAFSEHTQRREG